MTIANRIIRWVATKPNLMKRLEPFSEWYCDLAGYRKMGLKYDDLIPEENEVVQTALKRLGPRVAYDRVYRIRRAVQCSLSHKLLPAEEQTKPHEDVPYLQPLIWQVEAEKKEREDFDAIVVKRRPTA